MKFQQPDFIKWWNKTNKQTNQAKISACVRECLRSISHRFWFCLGLPCQSLWIWHHYCLWVCIPRYSLNMRNWWTEKQQQQRRRWWQQESALWADTFDIVILCFPWNSTTAQPISNGKIQFVAFALSISLSFGQIRNPIQIKCHPLMSPCHSNCEWIKMITVMQSTTSTKRSESIDRSINWTLIDIVLYFDLNEFQEMTFPFEFPSLHLSRNRSLAGWSIIKCCNVEQNSTHASCEIVSSL